jgi:hypothetical protein
VKFGLPLATIVEAAMTKGRSVPAKKTSRNRRIGVVLTAAALTATGVIVSNPNAVLADENGVSFWLPGQFGSLAAVPAAQPGWALAIINYYTNVSASGSVAASREVTIGKLGPTINVNLNATISANADLAIVSPSYVFATPVFGGQFALSMAGIVGQNNTGLQGTLTAGIPPLPPVTVSGAIDDSRTGFGDLYPQASLRWNKGANNWMTYLMGDIPVGAYDPGRLANLGIGHGAVDGGVGYTYFDPQTGHEFSAVTGLTGNLTNPSTGYTSGIDWHVDWGASQFITKQMHVGAVGYFYQQITPDSGAAPFLGSNESRVAAVGPEVGFIIPAGSVQAYLNLKAYWEFAAENRPSGWNAWVTLALSPSAPPAASPSPPMTTK